MRNKNAYKRRYKPVRAYQWTDDLECRAELQRDASVIAATLETRWRLYEQMTSSEVISASGKPLYFVISRRGPEILRTNDWIVFENEEYPDVMSDAEFKRDFVGFDEINFKTHVRVQNKLKKWLEYLEENASNPTSDTEKNLQLSWRELRLNLLDVQSIESELWHTKLALGRAVYNALEEQNKKAPDVATVKKVMETMIEGTIFPRSETQSWETIMYASSIDYFNPFGEQEQI